MTVKEFMKLTRPGFRITVKEPGQCFSYSCLSDNATNYEDFADREIYRVDFDSRRVYCW